MPCSVARRWPRTSRGSRRVGGDAGRCKEEAMGKFCCSETFESSSRREREGSISCSIAILSTRLIRWQAHGQLCLAALAASHIGTGLASRSCGAHHSNRESHGQPSHQSMSLVEGRQQALRSTKHSVIFALPWPGSSNAQAIALCVIDTQLLF